MRFRGAHLARLALLAWAALATGCTGFQRFPWWSPQRWPEPMETTQDPLAPGDASRYPRGPEEVRVLRHSDPVHVRMADSAGSIPLSYRRKELRVPSGSGVASSSGGRVELLWSTGSSVVFSGQTDVVVGSPSRGEPSVIFRDLEQVRFDPRNEDLYELVGGATLRVREGPMRVTRVRPEVLRVSNESKGSAQIAFRDATILLDPGQAIDLPLLSSGSRPPSSPEKLTPLQGPGFPSEYAEGAEVSAEGNTLVARGEGDVRALGIRVKVGSGTQVRFAGRPGGENRPPPSDGKAP